MMKDGRFGWKRYHVKMFNTFVTITCTVTEFIERNSDALWVHEIKFWDGLVIEIFVQAKTILTSATMCAIRNVSLITETSMKG